MSSLPQLNESATAMADLDPNPLAVLGQNRRALYGNPAARALCGTEDGTPFEGRRIGEILHCIHSLKPEGCGDTPHCEYCGANRAIRGGLEGTAVTDECRITAYSTGGNTSLEFSVQTRPVEWNGEKAVFCSLKDISHEKRRKVLERSFFNNILGAAVSAQSLSETLLKSQTDPSTADLVQQMRESCGAMVTEIRTQQTLLAAETDRLQVAWKKVAVADCIKEAVAMASSLSAAAGKSIFPVSPRETVTFWTDPELLALVLMNMLKNALEATMPGREVRLRGQVAGDKVEFSVWNDGLVSREARMQMFQRSYSTKGAGRGIGTYSLRLFAESYLGGQVSFTSGENGTTFTVSLPLMPKAGPTPHFTVGA